MALVKLFTHKDLDGEGCAILLGLEYGINNLEIERCSVYEVDEKVKDFIESEEFKTNNYSKVYITDISLKDKEIIELIDKEYNSLFVLIDHHSTALWLNEFDWCDIRLTHDNGLKACGTSLIAEYIQNSMEVNYQDNLKQLIEHIRAYDTWDWTRNGNETANDLNLLYRIKGYKYFYKKYTQDVIYIAYSYSLFNTSDLEVIVNEKEKCSKYIENRLKNVRYVTIQDMRAGVIFAEEYINDLAQEMYNTLDIDIAIVIDMGKERMSFRCKKDVPMLEYVQSIGGGGHPKSCGAPVNKVLIDDFISKIF